MQENPHTGSVPAQHNSGVHAPNAEQSRAWNGDDGRHWVDHTQRYESILQGFDRPLLQAAELSTADRVLDVGCGCGQSTFAAARLVPTGAVTGLDLSEPMLAYARDRAGPTQSAEVTFELGDAQRHAFLPGGYDAVISRFGVMFFADPSAAFTNIAAAVRPGGRLAFVCWQPADRNPWTRKTAGTLAEYVDFPDEGEHRCGPFAFADPARIREVLAGTGFVDVDITAITEPMRTADDVEDAIGFICEGSMATALTEAGPDLATRALDAVRAALAPHETDDGLVLPGHAWLVSARRA
ncbi:methyltransferase domain-containing protein [Allosaccharopolyspora coralli]|uniref:Methyltransferase domain-containing protein n=1 Tax=Allosaccharopolyspora coralli TaxID=2665642 RepID=A0A5Q3Q9D4_9PSEU|nr:class I SAM-dependent methyltransferase [Allosaccharopolyspora coralli]QGK70460.1 methyltransferase domain-containing protein [Allosaccharopolyspora coralli]